MRTAISFVVSSMTVALLSGAALAGCEFDAQGEGRVSGIVDPRTVRLDDGRDIRLDGIEIPDAGVPRADASALAHLALGHTITLQAANDAPDRYGRQRGFVFLEGADSSVQSVLLTQGVAVASGTVAESGCAAELSAAEAAARAAKRGIWANPDVIKNAESPGDILARIGQFALVEGKVQSARQAGATFYINFGRRWTRDFAVTIPRRAMPLLERTGIPLKSLENRRIRVRGWIEQRGGPRIEVSRPGQIELADE